MGRKSKSSRRRARHASLPAARPVPGAREAEPERPLLERIAAGELDPHLIAIAEAIRARSELLETVASAEALAELRVGDRIRINHRATPRYLHGVEGTVLALDDEGATVCVHRPIGRFKSGEIRCPPLVLDRLPELHERDRGQAAA
ncbi:MAG: hypothetical protein ACM3N0_04380 [Chloroflexota bacterium]